MSALARLPEVAAKATRERHVCSPGKSVAWAKTGHRKKQRAEHTLRLDGDALGVNRAKVAVGEKVDEAASNGLGRQPARPRCKSDNNEALLVLSCLLQRLQS